MFLSLLVRPESKTNESLFVSWADDRSQDLFSKPSFETSVDNFSYLTKDTDIKALIYL